MMKPKAGFEGLYAELLAKKDGLNERKEVAKAEAIAKVEQDFVAEEEDIMNVLLAIPMVEEPEEAKAEVEDAGEDLLVEEQPSEEVVNEEVVEG